MNFRIHYHIQNVYQLVRLRVHSLHPKFRCLISLWVANHTQLHLFWISSTIKYLPSRPLPARLLKQLPAETLHAFINRFCHRLQELIHLFVFALHAAFSDNVSLFLWLF